MKNFEYAGFWVRVAASLIDTILILIIILPILLMIYGADYWTNESFFMGFWDVIFNIVLPAVAITLFWFYKSATPGKLMLKLKIVDAKTGDKISNAQIVGRYLGYYISAIPLLLGLFWVGIDKHKQGWHDKLAGTVVVKNSPEVEPA